MFLVLCIPNVSLLPFWERNEFCQASKVLNCWRGAHPMTEGGLYEVRGEVAQGKYV